MLLLAGAAVLTTADPVQARGGGGHGGGGHGGGFHAGGYHGGGYHGGGIGGYHGGYYHGGYGRSFGSRPYYSHRHYYRGHYPYYGYYPYYHNSYISGGGDSLENAYADDLPLLGDSVTYDSGYKGLSAQEYQAYAQARADDNASAPTPVDTTAHVKATVPADAEIWFDGTKTTSTGAVRQFQSPPLTLGQRYNYEIRARWSENGHEVTQTQKVEVTAGSHINVTFPVRPNAAG
jgi:uncharacterized protein (TIGR03000 family)